MQAWNRQAHRQLAFNREGSTGEHEPNAWPREQTEDKPRLDPEKFRELGKTNGSQPDGESQPQLQPTEPVDRRKNVRSRPARTAPRSLNADEFCEPEQPRLSGPKIPIVLEQSAQPGAWRHPEAANYCSRSTTSRWKQSRVEAASE